MSKIITGIIQGNLSELISAYQNYGCYPENINQVFENWAMLLGKKVVTETKKWDEKRTIDQNRGLWRWNKILSDHTGFTEEEAHYVMCGELYGYKTLELGGRQIQKPNKTTSGMSTSEFSHHIMLYEIKARELFGITLPPFSYEEI
jgi:hypothetical protein